MKSLDVMAWLWLAEGALTVLYALVSPSFLSGLQYDQFLRALPLLTALIAAQGGATYWGKQQQK